MRSSAEVTEQNYSSSIHDQHMFVEVSTTPDIRAFYIQSKDFYTDFSLSSYSPNICLAM